MTDWYALISSPEFFGLIISALLGVLLASFVQWLQKRINTNDERRKTAALLGYEIASIRLISAQSLKINQYTLTEFKKSLDNGIIIHITIADVDFSRTVYDRPSINLTLFNSKLASTISELYRWIDFSKRVKQNTNNFSADLENTVSILKTLSIPSREMIQRVELSKANFIHWFEGYLNDLQRINNLSQDALKGINEITQIDETNVEGDKFPQFEPAIVKEPT